MRLLNKQVIVRDEIMSLGIVLILVSVFAGAYGTIIGAGGGFIFVPFLLILFGMNPKIAAGSGLVIVMVNSIIGTWGYSKKKRISFNKGLILGISAIPGTFIGTWLLQNFYSDLFYIVFALMLTLLGIFLLVKNLPFLNKKETKIIKVSESVNKSFGYWFIPLGFFTGILSNYLGIGGGWLLVPILIYFFKMSAKDASSTSIFSLCIYTTVGAITQISIGNINWLIVIIGSIGISIGAKIGLKIAEFIPEKLIMQLLSIVLIVMGMRMFFI